MVARQGHDDDAPLDGGANGASGAGTSSMQRALILHPPVRLSRQFIDTPYFTLLGAYQAAAVLREAGWDVGVVDGFATADADWALQSDSVWLGQNAEAYLRRVRAAGADLVVVHTSPFLLSPTSRAWLRRLVASVDRSQAGSVVLAEMFSGGMHYLEVDPNQLLDELPSVDRVLRYECEPLLRRLGGKTPLQERVWENHDAFSLAELPGPAFDLLDADAYFGFLGRVLGAAWRPGPFPAEPTRTLPLVTARGCPFGCSFCTKNPGLPGERRQLRAIPMARVAVRVEEWQDRFGLERLAVLDELVNLDAERFDDLLELAERRSLRLEFPNGLRADRVRPQQVSRLARLTSRLKVSLESSSRRVQDELLDKHLDPASVRAVAGWCQQQGLPLDVHYLIGIPGERRSEMRDTIGTAAELHHDHGARPLLQFATPLPGTRLEQQCREQGWLTERPTDLANAFQGRGIIRTDEFDPDTLEAARWILTRLTDSPPERKVIANLTYQCNNRCSFCAVGDRAPHHADARAIRSALRRYRDDAFELLDFDGGEPTLHPDLLTLVANAKRLGFRRISVVTNGRRASYFDYARSLASSGVDEVLVSLHAPTAGLHDSLTHAPGSFEQTVAGIANVLRAMPSAEDVAVNTTVVVDNVSQLEELAAALLRWGVRRWNLQVVTPFGRATGEMRPDEATLRAHLLPLLDGLRPKLRVQLINCPPCFVPGHERAAAVDFAKAERDMVFVGEAGENLQAFLSRRRRHTERCAECLYALLCPGEYVFGDRGEVD
jgi:MoaA/NifB/PqqE/SkfB family radical SAM enzyme